MNEMEKEKKSRGARTRPAGNPAPVRIMLLLVVVLGTVLVFPVPAAGIVFTGNVSEYITDDLSIPVGGMGVGLWTKSVTSPEVIKQADYTFTDSNGGFGLSLPPGTDPTYTDAYVILNKGTAFDIERVESGDHRARYMAGLGLEIVGYPDNNLVGIKYPAPLDKRPPDEPPADFGDNVFVLRSRNQQIPTGAILLQAGSATGSAASGGKNVFIPIRGYGNQTISRLNMTLDHAGCTGMTFVDAWADDALNMNTPNWYARSDDGSAVTMMETWGLHNGDSGTVGNSIFWLVKFHLPETTAPCTLKLTRIEGYRKDGTPIPFLAGDGQISPFSLRGDCNHDGAITGADVTMALQMAAGSAPADLVCDMDGDGRITAADAQQIQKLNLLGLISSVPPPPEIARAWQLTMFPALSAGTPVPLATNRRKTITTLLPATQSPTPVQVQALHTTATPAPAPAVQTLDVFTTAPVPAVQTLDLFTTTPTPAPAVQTLDTLAPNTTPVDVVGVVHTKLPLGGHH